MKKCGKCSKELSMTGFFKNRARYDGLSGYCKKCHSEQTRPLQHELRKRVLNYLGGKCVQCSFSDFRALHIDHINGGGGAERKTGKWKRMYRDVLLGKRPDLQLLCANCNLIKKVTHKEF